jgi:Uncharacterized conserved protein
VSRVPEAGPKPLPPEVLEGIRLYREGRYHAAHTAFEGAWKTARGPARDLYQGLLQVAVACHHLERGSPARARTMIRRAREKLLRVAGMKVGVDVPGLLADLDAMEGALEAGETGTTGFSRPRMRLI